MDKVFEALERLAMPDELRIEECKRLDIDDLTEDYEIVKQALIKALEMEKENDRYKQLEEKIDGSLEVVVDILLALKNRMVKFNHQYLYFKDEQTEKKLIDWLTKDKSE